jgi:thermitase
MTKLSLFIAALAISGQALAGEYLVKYKSSSAFMVLNDQRIQVLDQHQKGQYFKVNIDQRDEGEVLAKLLSQKNIEYVVPNFKLHAMVMPGAALDMQGLRKQWANEKVNAEKAWQRAGNKGKKDILVAVIDTGVDYNHESLKANMVPGYNFKDKNNDPMDKTGSQNPGHGTHCAGSVGGTGDVDNGISGLAPGIAIMPLRFLGENGSGDLNDAIKAIDHAIANNVDVISASWGAGVPRSQAQPLLDAIKRADDKGIIFVAAAANDGANNDRVEMYPANSGFPNTITVAASGPSDAKPSWSNYGRARVHVSAPGEDIMSTLPKNKYGNLSGTSMATPLVSGLVALVKSQDPSLTGAQVRALIQLTGEKVNIETACNCRVDAFNAIDVVMSKKMFITPAAGTLALNETMSFTGVYGKPPFTFESSNTSTATIDANGVLTAVANGETQITVKDSTGQVSQSLPIYVGAKSGGGDNPPDDGGGGFPPPGGGDGECPIGDPMLCQIICGIKPDLPFCSQ